jgi:hypothetical protein
METPKEFAESQVRRFMTSLFIARARRHLRTLATIYNWTPETLAAHESRFIRTEYMVPRFIPVTPPIPEDSDDSDSD